MPAKVKIKERVDAMRSGDRSALARLLSRIEAREKDLPEIVRAIYPLTGKAQIIGITGPPGAGKSTLVDGMTAKLRASGKRVAIACVDPSSPFTGGAILGDRIRMQSHIADSGVHIRSMGTRGMHGGLSLATREAVMAMDAAGFDVVIAETAGVGQTELEILKLAQTVVVVLVPESGDGIQVMKAGIMEIADVFAVNKSDRPQADSLVKELSLMVGLAPENSAWNPPIVRTKAHQGDGIVELLKSIESHQVHLRESGALEEKSRSFAKTEVLELLEERARESGEAFFHSKKGKDLLNRLALKKIDPYLATKEILKSIR